MCSVGQPTEAMVSGRMYLADLNIKLAWALPIDKCCLHALCNVAACSRHCQEVMVSRSVLLIARLMLTVSLYLCSVVTRQRCHGCSA